MGKKLRKMRNLQAITPTLQRTTRHRKATEFFGNPVPSSLKGMVGSVVEQKEIDAGNLVTDSEFNTNQSLIQRARETEISGWREFNVMKEVDRNEVPEGYQILSIIWVEVWKNSSLGKRYIKSRLCVRGNLEKSSNVMQTYAPTASREILMACLSVMTNSKWRLQSMDVEKAFLQSGPIDRLVFVRPPKGAGTSPNIVWKLNTAAYGLTDAARRWYTRLYSVLTELGLRRSATEPAVFYLLGHEENLRGILITHVDDFLFAGDEEFLRIIDQVKAKIKIGSESAGNIKFCGMDLTTREDGALEIKLDNSKAGKIEFMHTKEKGATRRLTPDEETQIRGRIGHLQWFACVSS